MRWDLGPVILLLVAGCQRAAPASVTLQPGAPLGEAPPPPEPDPGARPSTPVDPAETTVRFALRLPPTYHFIGETVWLDEERALSSTRPDARRSARVSRGKHTLELAATVGAAGGHECRIHREHAFTVNGSAPADISATLFVREADGRVDARFELTGAVPPTGDGTTSCDPLAPPDAAVCRAEIYLALAQEQKDVVKAVCTREKLAVMRPLQQARAEALARLAQLTGPDRTREAARAEFAARRLTALGEEADHCHGEELIFLPWEHATAPDCSAPPARP
jgi:hypothetical protein